MVAYKVEKRPVSDKIPGTEDGMPMPQWLFLVYKVNSAAIIRRFLCIWSFITRPNNEADLFYAGPQYLLDEDA
jgi:hypothetical protein